MGSVARQDEFRVDVQRSSAEGADQMGLAIQRMTDNTFIIESVKEDGLIPAWNKLKLKLDEPELVVQSGDFIVAINGLSGDLDKMLATLQDTSVALTVRRAVNRPPPQEVPVSTPEQEPAVLIQEVSFVAAIEEEEGAADAPAVADEPVVEPPSQPRQAPAPAVVEFKPANLQAQDTSAEFVLGDGEVGQRTADKICACC
eukprot:TRINITY_DN80774_c0_g1_i1.p1 TRINITY_DN80774_c0_g1~~TRINITY_DN80774_c0_g1_i1.p1  ORF type:complete len:200 (-),score=38.92 TRINITY_DN80774_c0_g1_i1:182-781(-)